MISQQTIFVCDDLDNRYTCGDMFRTDELRLNRAIGEARAEGWEIGRPTSHGWRESPTYCPRHADEHRQEAQA